MLAAERRQFILEELRREGKVLAGEMSTKLEVSEDTIRRDLNELSDEGKLQRVHGGALLASPDATTTYSARRENIGQNKIAIAKHAASLVQDGQVIFLSGGTTNVELAASIPKHLGLTVITHSPPVAMVLSEHNNIEVILVGGRLVKRTMLTVGVPTVDAFRSVNADICFLGVCSLHSEFGISMPNLEEVYVQQAMISKAAEVVALANSEKINTVSTNVVGPLSELTQLITNSDVSEAILKNYRKLGIVIHLV